MTARNAPAMMKIDAKTVCLMAVVLSSLCAGCSGGEAVRTAPETQARQFSPEERAAARALSINQVRSVTDPASPYAKAVLCKNGLDVVAQRLQSVSIMNSQQRQLLQQAQAYFDRQLHTLAEQEGKSVTDIRNDLEQAAQDHSDAQENARIAVACLEGLQDAS